MQHPCPVGYYDSNDPFGSLAGGRSYPHTGSDYSLGYGSTVESIANSVVYHVGYNSGNGNYVCVYVPGMDWKYGVQGGLYIAYLHLSAIYVSEGATVAEGQAIGLSGNSGSNSRGPHLHITMSNSDLAYLGIGDKVDPYALIEAVRATPAPVPPKPAPAPVKPLTELQKLRLQRTKIQKEIRAEKARLKGKPVQTSPRLERATKKLASIIAKIKKLTLKK